MNERNEKEITTGEIMEYLQGDLMGFLQEHMVTREEFRGLETKVDKLDDRVGSLEVKVNQTKLDMLDGMDEKLGALKGDLVVMMRGEDKKLMFMVQKLKDKKIFDDSDVNEFLALLPFPQTVRPS